MAEFVSRFAGVDWGSTSSPGTRFDRLGYERLRLRADANGFDLSEVREPEFRKRHIAGAYLARIAQRLQGFRKIVSGFVARQFDRHRLEHRKHGQGLGVRHRGRNPASKPEPSPCDPPDATPRCSRPER